MRRIAPLAPLAGVLLLAACGSADDAATEASADTVEMPADEALSGVSEEPVADPSASATDAPAPTPAPTTAGAEEAGEAAANVAAEAAAAAGEAADQ